MKQNSSAQNSLPPTARSLPISLIRAREAVMAPIRAMLVDSGLTEQQWRILRVLDEYGPVDATRLSHYAGLLAPSVTRIVQSMAQNEFIQRQPDPDDRRRQVISLLPKGRAIIEDNLEEGVRITRQFRQTLGEEDYEHLLDLLDRLIDFRVTEAE